MADVSVGVRAKRKRGRPRKDSNLCTAATLQSPENSILMKPQDGDHQLIYHPTPAAAAEDATKKLAQDAAADKNCSDDGGGGMVGSMVYGVVEGFFDAGFLISVRIGNNHTPFRGVVFQPRKVVAVTPANDVAPQAKMYQRREIPVPVYNNNVLSQASTGFSPHSDQRGAAAAAGALQPPKQAVVRPFLPSVAPSYTTSHNQSSFMAAPDDHGAAMMRIGSSCNVEGKFPYVGGSLRMVEEDEVMQAFEVSTSSGGSKSNLANNGDMAAATAAASQEQPQAHGKAVESPHSKPQPSAASNLQMCHNPSAFEIQQDEMICRETIDQLQEMTQNRSAPTAQPQSVIKTPLLRPSSNLFQDVNFHENLFSTQSRQQESSLAAQLVDNISKSPNLKLDLAFAVDKEKQMAAEEPQGGGGGIYTAVLNGMKNPNIGFHQALVAGNPLLLPPDLMGEPLEFMEDKPKTPHNSQETNMEVQSRLVGSGEGFQGGCGGVGDDAMNNGEAAGSPSAASAYNLELATPQTGLNTRIADMDFVLSNAMQQQQPPAQSHINHG